MFHAEPVHSQMSAAILCIAKVGLHFASQVKAVLQQTKQVPAGSTSRMIRGCDNDNARPLWFCTEMSADGITTFGDHYGFAEMQTTGWRSPVLSLDA